MMFKKAILWSALVVLFGWASISQALVIGDWEDDLQSWELIAFNPDDGSTCDGMTTDFSTTGVTLGGKSLRVSVPCGNWKKMMRISIQSMPELVEAFRNGKTFQIDVTRLTSEWTGDPSNGHSGLHFIINAGGDGWSVWYNGLGDPDDTGSGYQGWWKYDQGDRTQTVTWDYSGVLPQMEFDNIWWLELWVISNYDDAYATGGVYYFDNARIPAFTKASEPEPADGATEVKRDPTLIWKSGEYAGTHDVYFGTDLDEVTNATKDDLASTPGVTYASVDVNSFTPDALELGKTYYWRVDEINDLNPDSPWIGEIWSFTVGDFLVIDDFEDYNNFSPYTIWESWIDGFGVDENGSVVGHDLGSTVDPGEYYVELDTVHTGDQAMPYYYENDFKYSEATMTLEGAKRDWTREGVERLSLWYYGYPASQGNFVESPQGTYTMTGAGRDIWNTADEFHYAYRMLNGVGSITARVSAIESVDPNQSLHEWAKAGVMIRSTLDPNSAHGIMCVTGDQGISFQYRGSAASTSTNQSHLDTVSARPHWVRIERDFSGNVIAWHADDAGGSAGTWMMVDQALVELGTDVYIGLALTSHQRYIPARATFTEVSTTGNVTGDFTNIDIGIRSNEPEQMFVSIANAGGDPVVETNPDGDAALVNEWTEWSIPLTDFEGIDLSDVDQISLGFGSEGNNQAGGSGLVYFDDIRLYRKSCALNLRSADFAAADFAPLGSPGGDCVVDYQELELLAADWLMGDVLLDAENRAANPAAYYPMNAGSGAVAVDATGNGHDGTIIGDNVQWVSSQAVFDQALEFPGAAPNYVDVGTWNPSEETGELSIAVWANWAGYNGGWQGLMGKRDAWDNQGSEMMWHLEIGRDSNEVGFARGGSYPGGNYLMEVGEWTHVAVTFDGVTATTYINGAENGSGDFSFGPKTDAALVIGCVGANGSNPFNGVLDEVYIFDRAISAEEVAHLAALSPGELLVPLSSPADVSSDEPDGSKVVNFKDFAVIAEYWLEEELF